MLITSPAQSCSRVLQQPHTQFSAAGEDLMFERICLCPTFGSGSPRSPLRRRRAPRGCHCSSLELFHPGCSGCRGCCWVQLPVFLPAAQARHIPLCQGNQGAAAAMNYRSQKGPGALQLQGGVTSMNTCAHTPPLRFGV